MAKARSARLVDKKSKN